ncbi:MAG: hypothetical protein K9I80_13090, partial [Ignavibacteriales bacterium]|nr:hypothetical protein [Ignavibacteriales bacterium]
PVWLYSEPVNEDSGGDTLCFTYPETEINAFLDSLFCNYRNAIENNFGDALDRELEEFDDISDISREELLKLFFFHKLFTCSSCIDGNNTGIWQIPYFWHWVEPNPRYEIVLLPDSLRLNEIKPSAEYNAYKTFADIDRTALLFLNDLFSDDREYYHPLCGKFKTFGWCSEREMAFNIILKLYGYECKIVASGNHSWSEFYGNYKYSDDKAVRLVIEIDNTFDVFRIQKCPENFKLADWQKKQGTSDLAKWYNDKANDSDVLNKFNTFEISSDRITELDEMVREYFQD